MLLLYSRVIMRIGLVKLCIVHIAFFYNLHDSIIKQKYKITKLFSKCLRIQSSLKLYGELTSYISCKQKQKYEHAATQWNPTI